MKSDSRVYDWKNTILKRGWKYRYDAPHDKDWQKDRSELFAELGNGWWWFGSVPELQRYQNRYENDGEPTTADKYNKEWLDE